MQSLYIESIAGDGFINCRFIHYDIESKTMSL